VMKCGDIPNSELHGAKTPPSNRGKRRGACFGARGCS
jgi:hypothetical protein